MTLPEMQVYWPHAQQLLLAFVVGGVIGFERQLHGRPAGLRTHILVCLGSALIAMVDTLIPSSQGKITAQIVTGVGFLGAGTILRGGDGSAVHGLTTAASLWCSAGVGIAIGSGGLSMWMALTAAGLVLLTLTFVEVLERVVIHYRKDREIAIYIRAHDEESGAKASSNIIDAIVNTGTVVRGVTTELLDPGSQAKLIHVKLTMGDLGTLESVSKVLVENPNVSQFAWVN